MPILTSVPLKDIVANFFSSYTTCKKGRFNQLNMIKLYISDALIVLNLIKLNR